jgi:hypothetical protein
MIFQVCQVVKGGSMLLKSTLGVGEKVRLSRTQTRQWFTKHSIVCPPREMCSKVWWMTVKLLIAYCL